VCGVTEKKATVILPSLGNECVKSVDNGPLDVVGVECAVAGQQVLHEFMGWLLAGLGLGGAEKELVTTPAVSARHDDVRAPRVPVVHAVLLVVGISRRVDDKPRLVETSASHGDV
jgi:hypothetical protein